MLKIMLHIHCRMARREITIVIKAKEEQPAASLAANHIRFSFRIYRPVCALRASIGDGSVNHRKVSVHRLELFTVKDQYSHNAHGTPPGGAGGSPTGRASAWCSFFRYSLPPEGQTARDHQKTREDNPKKSGESHAVR